LSDILKKEFFQWKYSLIIKINIKYMIENNFEKNVSNNHVCLLFFNVSWGRQSSSSTHQVWNFNVNFNFCAPAFRLAFAHRYFIYLFYFILFAQIDYNFCKCIILSVLNVCIIKYIHLMTSKYVFIV